MSTQVPTVADLFVLMDRWRSLPSYQLERRADIFFAPFLAGFVGSMEGVVIAPTIVPEFPVRQQDSNRTDKVDYVLFSADRTRVFFLELKTDVGSLRTEQNQYLARAARMRFDEVLDGLLQAAAASEAVKKYLCLAELLVEAGVLNGPPKRQEGARALARDFRAFSVAPGAREASRHVRFLQPRCADKVDPALAGVDCRVWDFAALEGYLRGVGGVLADELSRHLTRWARPPADD